MEDLSQLEEEQESMQQDSLKLELHSVPLNLNWDDNEEEFEIDEDLEEEFDLMAMLDDPDQPSTSGLNNGASTTTTVLNDVSDVAGQSSEDNKNEEPEEELIDLSSDLEANPENLLKLNIAYQEVLQQQLHTIDALLNHNQIKQEELKAEHEESENTQTKAKAHLGLSIAPFFRASMLMPEQILHPDVIRRKQEVGELYVENPMPPPKWTKADEKRLKNGVERLKLKALTEPILSNIEYLQEKYARSEDPEIKKKIELGKRQLSEAKETKLSKLYGDRFEEQDWTIIANVDMGGTRTWFDCATYWKNSLHPSINKSAWKGPELEKLKTLATKYKRKSWPIIAKELGTGRTPLQCCRKFQSTNTDHKNSPWTPEDDKKLTKYVQEYGIGDAIPFALIALKMGNRMTSQVQVRWTKSLDPRIKKTKWTPDEDVKLLQSIAKYGLRWAHIRNSGDLPGRSDQQCRERYDNVLRDINRGPWTKEEDDVIGAMIKEHGEGKWSMIANQLHRRTDNQVLHRWKRLQRLRSVGRKIIYRKPETVNNNNADNLSTLRQKLIVSIEKELQRKKEQENNSDSLSIEEDSSLNISRELLVPQTDSLPKPEMVKPEERNEKSKYNLKMEEKLKGDLRPNEMMELYRYLSAKHTKRAVDPSWIRSDKIINEKVRALLSRQFQPFKYLAAETKSNIHAIREKVLLTDKKITSKHIFIHYVKGMNINAAKTLQAINKNPPPLQPSPKTTRKGKRKSSSNSPKPSKDVEPPEAAVSSFPAFKRNHFLPLCAPNRATVNAYRNLVKDRERRVRTAKLMLINKNKGKQNGETESTSGESTLGNDVLYDGKKYKPEDLMKNIALTHEHRILRSRFVSMFAWPTILSTLVPYHRCGGLYRLLRPAVKLKNEGTLKSTTALTEDEPPSTKRRKLDDLDNGTAA